MIIDSNAWLGHWPFHSQLPGQTVESAISRMKSVGISAAWVSRLEGLFDRDVAAINLQLAQDCQAAHTIKLIPFGIVNPMMPDWQDDLRRCHEVHHFTGIRIAPGFHGYDLNSSAFHALLTDATSRRLIVQLIVTMEDERTQHPVFRVPFVDLGPLAQLVDSVPGLRLVVLNAFRKLSMDEAARLSATRKVWFDIAMLEGVDRLSALVERVTPDRILFGSHFPLFYVQSADLKLKETKLPDTVRHLISIHNATVLCDKN